MSTLVLDIETNGLIEQCDRIWVMHGYNLEDGSKKTWFPSNPKDVDHFKRTAEGVTRWVGHNFVKFDAPIINRFIAPSTVDYNLIFDTLVGSRVLNYSLPGGHSLDAWGKRFNLYKPEIEKWDVWDPAMVPRVQRDVAINVKLYQLIMSKISLFPDGMDLEQKVQVACKELSETGFWFDIKKAEEYHNILSTGIQEYDRIIEESFKPTVTPVREINPVLTKAGTLHAKDFRGEKDLRPYSAGHPFTRIIFTPFDPNSPKQIVSRMNAAGWKPTEKTDGHLAALKKKKKDKLDYYKEFGWKVSEENLSTLPMSAPEGAKVLGRRIALEARRRKLVEWLDIVDRKDSRIHGDFNGVGAWSHRMSHRAPNMANVFGAPKVIDPKHPTPVEQIQMEWNIALRSLFGVPPGRAQVGVDADQIQLRILAHLTGDEESIEALVSGDKDKHTDVHSLNAVRLGLANTPSEVVNDFRQRSKTFIYAWLLGAGTGMVASILKCSNKEAKERIEEFINRTSGLKELKEGLLAGDFRRGFLHAIDGRPVVVPATSSHFVLAGHLQSGEAIVMKKAFLLAKERLPEKSLLINVVHDEMQWETDDNPESIQEVKDIASQAIIEAGEYFQLRCPLAAEAKHGYNWGETH